jgi:putative transferase (TIGR04331 family)
MYQADNRKVFLATTALEEFWDTTKPIVFLGDWCLRHSRRSMWEQLQGEVIQSPLGENESLYEAYRYVTEVYEKVLPRLSQALNDLHIVDYSDRYWRIVTGPWLIHYIHHLYDRHMSIRKVLDNYPAFTTYGLAENNFVVPESTSDFLLLLQDDAYNLQVYTKILSVLGKEFPRRKHEIIPRQFGPLKDSIKRLVLSNIIKLLPFNHKVILKDSYFDRLTELKIVLMTQGKVFPNIKMMTKLSPMQVNLEKRKSLSQYLPDGDEFYCVLKNTLPTDIPLCYVEAYKQIEYGLHADYPAAPKAIVSATSWYSDEPFKQWAAFSAENGAKLIGLQHGGNYGSLCFMALEDHELAITDRFYSWGWERADCFSEVVVMPASKLSARKLLGAKKEKKGILFAGTGTLRYLYRFQQFHNYQFANYLQWQMRFVNALTAEVRNELRVRPHQEEYGWDIWQRWKDAFPDVCLESWQVTFLKSLANCRLYVCDHLSTTFTEALAVNKPSILFWDPTINEVREEAKPYYDALHSAGILRYSPDDAADAVNVVYDDIKGWWDDQDRQDARQFFCNRFALTSADSVKEWISEFKRTVDEVGN